MKGPGRSRHEETGPRRRHALKTHATLTIGARFALLASLALPGACDANHVLGVADGGQNNPTGGSSGAAGSIASNSGAAGSGATGAGVAGSIASGSGTAGSGGGLSSETWSGTIDGYMVAPSGSNALKLEITRDDQDGVTGKMLFGEGLLPPPTDPNVGYPPNISLSPYPGSASIIVVEGFPYPLRTGSLSQSHLSVNVSNFAPWADWCALQTSPDGQGRCVQNLPEQYNDDGIHCTEGASDPINCGKLWLCGLEYPVCTCDKTGPCKLAPLGADLGMTVDVTISGDMASGHININGFGDKTVHLTKQP